MFAANIVCHKQHFDSNIFYVILSFFITMFKMLFFNFFVASGCFFFFFGFYWKALFFLSWVIIVLCHRTNIIWHESDFYPSAKLNMFDHSIVLYDVKCLMVSTIFRFGVSFIHFFFSTINLMLSLGLSLKQMLNTSA